MRVHALTIRRKKLLVLVFFAFSVGFMVAFLNGRQGYATQKCGSNEFESAFYEKWETIIGRSGNVNINETWKVWTKSSICKTGRIFPKYSKVPLTVTSPLIIPNQAVCSGYLKLIYVVVVHSAPNHFERRAHLRRTWANQSNHSRTVFLLGSTPNRALQADIYKENAQFGDIVQGTFVDDSKNLTLKAVMGLRWISENCRNVYYVIKADDDICVNVPRVEKNVFPTLEYHEKELICSVMPHALIFRRSRPNKIPQKFIVPQEYFKGLERYPMPFCSGSAVFHTMSLAVDLFEMAKSTPGFPVDDVHVYGILASKVNGLTWRDGRDIFYKENAPSNI